MKLSNLETNASTWVMLFKYVFMGIILVKKFQRFCWSGTFYHELLLFDYVQQVGSHE